VVLNENSGFGQLRNKLEMVDANDMSQNQVMTFLDPEAHDAENFTFFELMM